MRLRTILLTVPLALGLVGCPKLGDLGSALEPFMPKVTFNKVGLRDINWEQVDVNLVFNVENPNPLKVALATFSYDLDLAGTDLTSGTMKDGFTLPAEGKTKLKVPMTFVFTDMANLLSATKGQDKLGLKASGKMGFNTPVGVAQVPYKASGEMPVLRTPKFSFKNIKVASFEPLQNTATIKVNLGVLNKGEGSLDFKDFDYSLKLDGTKVGSGTVSALGAATGGNETTTLSLPIDLKLTQAGTAIVNLIKDKGDTKAALDASMTVATPFGDLPLSVNESGKVSFK